MKSTPASACFFTTSATAARIWAPNAVRSTGTPSSLAYMSRISCSGRGRLPVWVHRNRALLRFIGFPSPPPKLASPWNPRIAWDLPTPQWPRNRPENHREIAINSAPHDECKGGNRHEDDTQTHHSRWLVRRAVRGARFGQQRPRRSGRVHPGHGRGRPARHASCQAQHGAPAQSAAATSRRGTTAGSCEEARRYPLRPVAQPAFGVGAIEGAEIGAPVAAAADRNAALPRRGALRRRQRLRRAVTRIWSVSPAGSRRPEGSGGRGRSLGERHLFLGAL